MLNADPATSDTPGQWGQLLTLALVLVVGGCSGPGPVSSSLEASAASYRAGEPVFVLDAVASVRAEATGVDVDLGVPPSSLVFRPRDEDFAAVAEWVVTIEQEGGAPRSRSARDTLRFADAEGTRSTTPVWRAERFEAAPGRYVVRAVLEDVGSGRTAERRAVVTVPSPTGAPSLGGLRLATVGPRGTPEPVDVASVPTRLDSLRAVVQATAVPDGAVTALAVLRLAADDTPARRLDDFMPLEGTLIARGVDPSRVDTVQAVRQDILNPAAALDVEAPVPGLEPGVYRTEIRLLTADGEPFDTAERLFVVRRRDYPQVTRLGDLIGPLVYLASAGDLSAITEAATPVAQRRAFDAFWGERLDDRRLAAATVRAYYERVEEANRLFATYKDGWKTDRGMLYVLLGPPGYVETTPSGERWSYALGSGDPSVFAFERTASPSNGGAPLSVLTLRRSRVYADLVRRLQRQWRAGVVP